MKIEGMFIFFPFKVKLPVRKVIESAFQSVRISMKKSFADTHRRVTVP